MKKIKLSIYILIFLGISSCKKDFLEVIDTTVLLKQGYVVDLETTSHYMNGVYLDFANHLSGTYMPYPEVMADNMKPRRSSYFLKAYSWSFTNTQGGGFGDPLEMWTLYYKLIRSCSFVIEKANQYKGQNEIKAAELQGQAYAIRAIAHFALVNIFAQPYKYTNDGSHPGVPYIKDSDIETKITRNTVAEVYDNIVSDLTQAMELLPKVVNSRTVMNYNAVRAYLGRVYLFKENFVAAKDIAKEVLADVPMMVNGYPGKLYTNEDSESLFNMPPGASSVDNYYAIFTGYYSSPSVGGDFALLATDDIAKLLRENLNDKRSAWVILASQGWLIKKFPTKVTGTFVVADGDYYQSLIRSSEMCLTAAECFAKMNNEDSARFYINKIRQRANPALGDINATGNALLDSIYKERRKEMCFDGLRMFDLMRWKQGVNRIDATNPNAKTLPYPSDKAIAALPKQDVELSGLPQNAGY